jgi:hypothetical protein
MRGVRFTVAPKMTHSACHDARVPERPDSDREVLTSLPRSRPVRRSAKRGERPAPGDAARASATPVAPRKPRAGATPPRPSAERPAPPRVAPQRKVPAAGYAAPDARADATAGSAGAELIGTTIQAAAELAQIGLSVGRQTLRSMLDRLPKP